MDSLKLLLFLTPGNLRYLTWDICPMKLKEINNTIQIRKLLKIHEYVSKSGKHVFGDKVSWMRNIMKDLFFLDQVTWKCLSVPHVVEGFEWKVVLIHEEQRRFSILFSPFSEVFRQILFFWKISFPANFAARSGLPGLQETVWMLQIKSPNSQIVSVDEEMPLGRAHGCFAACSSGATAGPGLSGELVVCRGGAERAYWWLAFVRHPTQVSHGHHSLCSIWERQWG